MNLGITQIVSNLELEFEIIILIIFIFASIIPFAKDFRLGVLLQFLGSGILFMWFYHAGYDYTKIIVIFFMDLIVLSLNLYVVAKTTKQGGFV